MKILKSIAKLFLIGMLFYTANQFDKDHSLYHFQEAEFTLLCCIWIEVAK